MIKYKSNISKVSLVKEPTDIKKVKIACSKDSAEYAREFYHQDLGIYESMFLILLNRANNTIGYAKISQGGVAGTSVDNKIICKYALDSLASSIIIVHNHPSGNLNASISDKELTRKIKHALSYLDISLLDHIILTEDGYTSFADKSLL